MIGDKIVVGIVVGAGRSRRMGFDKLFYPIEGVEVLRHAVSRIDAHPQIDRLVVVAGDNIARVRALFDAHPTQKPLVVVEGAETRAGSVVSGVAACPDAALVAIHDGARPFVSAEVISRVLFAAMESGAAAPYLPVKDTVKRVENNFVVQTVPREGLVMVQTPQCFDRAAFTRAFAAIMPEEYDSLTDDCMVMERAGIPVRLVEGESANRKITTPEDLRAETSTPVGLLRVGQGYDAHRLVSGRRLVLGGVAVPFNKGLDGHSDADVLLHAVMDALLGAAALGDIGLHFPPDDPAYKDVSSVALLSSVGRMLASAGCEVVNLDATVVCQMPKLASHYPSMRQNIAGALGISEKAISVKATTEEGMGFTGQGEGMAAHCVALVQKRV